MATGNHKPDHDQVSAATSNNEGATSSHGAAAATEHQEFARSTKAELAAEPPLFPKYQPPPIPPFPTEPQNVGRLARKSKRKNPKDSPGHNWRHDEVHNIPHK